MCRSSSGLIHFTGIRYLHFSFKMETWSKIIIQLKGDDESWSLWTAIRRSRKSRVANINIQVVEGSTIGTSFYLQQSICELFDMVRWYYLFSGNKLSLQLQRLSINSSTRTLTPIRNKFRRQSTWIIHTLESNDYWVMLKHSFVLMLLHSLFFIPIIRYTKKGFAQEVISKFKMLIILETFVPVVNWIHDPKIK